MMCLIVLSIFYINNSTLLSVAQSQFYIYAQTFVSIIESIKCNNFYIIKDVYKIAVGYLYYLESF